MAIRECESSRKGDAGYGQRTPSALRNPHTRELGEAVAPPSPERFSGSLAAVVIAMVAIIVVAVFAPLAVPVSIPIAVPTMVMVELTAGRGPVALEVASPFPIRLDPI